MKSLIVASNFPDCYYPTLAPWSKVQVDSLKKYAAVDVEVIAPKPFVLPIKYLPYYKFSTLPEQEQSDLGYLIHYPRYPYFIPKTILFSLTGSAYSSMLYKYASKSIKVKPDLIHARFGYLDGYGALKICKKWNIPLIFDVHGHRDFGEYYGSLLIKHKHRQTLQYAQKILCVADWQIHEGTKIGISEDKLLCIPLGVDIDKFRPRNRVEIRRDYGIHGDYVILSVGQLIERKGISDLLTAISYLPASLKTSIKLLIVGDGPEKTRLRSATKKLGLSDVVIFIGKVSDEDLPKFYSMSDVFVLASYSEGRPTVINEAMASGCAIVATNVSGIPEQVKEGYNGFLVDPGDPKVLAEKIEYLLTNEDDLVRMGKNSRMRVIEEGWTWKNYAKKVSEIYNQVLNLSG